MANLNKVFLAGRLTRDPELQHTNSGTPFTRFTIAANRSYRDRNGNWQEETSFIDIVVWGDAADRAVSKFNKGTEILVEGRLRQSTWETDSGEKRSRIEIVAEKVQLLSQPAGKSQEQEDIDDIEF